MQSASSEFLAAAEASIRTPLAKLEIVWSDALIEPVTSVTSSYDNRGSQNLQVADTRNLSSYKYTLLDGTWALNQDYHLAPETAAEVEIYEIGYYSNIICDAIAGSYAFSSPIVLTVNMSSRTIQGIKLTGDVLLNEYATNFIIRVYSGATLLYQKIEANNTQVDIYYSGQYLNVTKLELTINNWSAPSTCAKITEFFTSFSTTYMGNDIIDLDLIEEREVRDSTLPIGNIASNELSFTLQNYVYGYGEWVQAGQKVLVKNEVQDVTNWAVFAIINNGSGSFIDIYVCPHEEIYGVDTWSFNYYYTIPGSLVTGDVIKLYFEPTGVDTGKSGAFTSQEWMIQDVVYEPYTPENPLSPFVPHLKPNRKIKAYLGFILENGSYDYLPIGTFWNNDWVIHEDNLTISTDSRDRLGILKDSIYKESPLFEGASLYFILNSILTDAKVNIPMNELTWSIDTVLSSMIVPYAYFDKPTYFEAIEQIVKACMGQCYVSKEDVIIIESYDKNLNINAPTTYLTKNEYFSIAQTFSYREILNKINVNYFTYELLASALFYTSDVIDIDASATLDPIEITFTNPVKDSGITASTTDETGGVVISIDSEVYYSWGAIITVSETAGFAGTFKLTFTGQELSETDTITISTIDSDSIDEFSEKEYDFPDNTLVQSEALASEIGQAIIDTYSDPSNDIEVNFSGNPAIELSDTMRVTLFKRGAYHILRDFIIYKSVFAFDGTLTGKLYGKKREYVGEIGDVLQDSDNANAANLYQDTDNAALDWQDSDS